MSIEQDVVRFICRTAYDDLHPEIVGWVEDISESVAHI